MESVPRSSYLSPYLHKQQVLHQASGNNNADKQWFNVPQRFVIPQADEHRHAGDSPPTLRHQHGSRNLQKRLLEYRSVQSGATRPMTRLQENNLPIRPVKLKPGMVNPVTAAGSSPYLPKPAPRMKIPTTMSTSASAQAKTKDKNRFPEKHNARALSDIHVGRGFLPNGARAVLRKASHFLNLSASKAESQAGMRGLDPSLRVARSFIRIRHGGSPERSGDRNRHNQLAMPGRSQSPQHPVNQPGPFIGKQDMRRILHRLAGNDRHACLKQFLLDAFSRMPAVHIDHEAQREAWRVRLESMLLRLEQESHQERAGYRDGDYLQHASHLKTLFARLSLAVREHVRESPDAPFDYAQWWKTHGRDEAGRPYRLD